MTDILEVRRNRKRKNNKLANAIASLSGASVGVAGMLGAFGGMVSGTATQPGASVTGTVALVLTSALVGVAVDSYVYSKLKKRTTVDPKVLGMAAMSPEIQPLLADLKRTIANRDSLIIDTAKGKNPARAKYRLLTNQMMKQARKAEPKVIRAAKKAKVDSKIIKEYRNFFNYAKSGDATFLDGTEV